MEEIRRIIDKEDNGDDNDVQKYKFTGAMNSNCPKKKFRFTEQSCVNGCFKNRKLSFNLCTRIVLNFGQLQKCFGELEIPESILIDGNFDKFSCLSCVCASILSRIYSLVNKFLRKLHHSS